jgi:hypothetical protein
MAESQRGSGKIRQVSPPVYNVDTGHWQNRVRVIEPNGAGGYRVVGNEEVYESKDKKFLPTPWSENINRYLFSKIPPIGFGALSARRGPNQRPGGLGEKLDRHRGTALGVKGFLDAWNEVNEAYRNGGNPLSGTPFDVPYHSWPGTEKPWDWSTVHPYGRDPAPRPNPAGFAPQYSDPERGSGLGDMRAFAASDPSEPPARPAGVGAPALTVAVLPLQVVATGHYLRANGYEITPRTMYVPHVLGPERAVDLFRRTGSSGSPPEIPSPDAATGEQMRAWVRALRGAAGTSPGGGIASPAPPSPALATDASAEARDVANNSFA